MATVASVPVYVSPSVEAALEQLDVLLQDYNYSPASRREILAYVRANGTPTGCASLDPEDEADASMVLEESFESVSPESTAWDREDVILDAELLAADVHPWPLIGCDDDEWRDTGEYDTLASLPPISGGAPEPFEPSPEDWACYREFCEEYDRKTLQAMMDDPRYGDVAAPSGALD